MDRTGNTVDAPLAPSAARRAACLGGLAAWALCASALPLTAQPLPPPNDAVAPGLPKHRHGSATPPPSGVSFEDIYGRNRGQPELQQIQRTPGQQAARPPGGSALPPPRSLNPKPPTRKVAATPTPAPARIAARPAPLPVPAQLRPAPAPAPAPAVVQKPVPVTPPTPVSAPANHVATTNEALRKAAQERAQLESELAALKHERSALAEKAEADRTQVEALENELLQEKERVKLAREEAQRRADEAAQLAQTLRETPPPSPAPAPPAATVVEEPAHLSSVTAPPARPRSGSRTLRRVQARAFASAAPAAEAPLSLAINPFARLAGAQKPAERSYPLDLMPAPWKPTALYQVALSENLALPDSEKDPLLEGGGGGLLFPTTRRTTPETAPPAEGEYLKLPELPEGSQAMTLAADPPAPAPAAVPPPAAIAPEPFDPIIAETEVPGELELAAAAAQPRPEPAGAPAPAKAESKSTPGEAHLRIPKTVLKGDVPASRIGELLADLEESAEKLERGANEMGHFLGIYARLQMERDLDNSEWQSVYGLEWEIFNEGFYEGRRDWKKTNTEYKIRFYQLLRDMQERRKDESLHFLRKFESRVLTRVYEDEAEMLKTLRTHREEQMKRGFVTREDAETVALKYKTAALQVRSYSSHEQSDITPAELNLLNRIEDLALLNPQELGLLAYENSIDKRLRELFIERGEQTPAWTDHLNLRVYAQRRDDLENREETVVGFLARVPIDRPDRGEHLADFNVETNEEELKAIQFRFTQQLESLGRQFANAQSSIRSLQEEARLQEQIMRYNDELASRVVTTIEATPERRLEELSIERNRNRKNAYLARFEAMRALVEIAYLVRPGPDQPLYTVEGSSR